MGRGTASRRLVVEGAGHNGFACGAPPSTKPLRALVPLPVNGEDFFYPLIRATSRSSLSSVVRQPSEAPPIIALADSS